MSTVTDLRLQQIQITFNEVKTQTSHSDILTLMRLQCFKRQKMITQ